MKQAFKRLTAVFAAAALAVNCLPLTAIAEPLPQEEILAAGDTGTYQDFEYQELSDGTVSVTGYCGTATEVAIPEKINGKTVSTVSSYFFSGGESITSLTLPSSITDLGQKPFVDPHKLNAYVDLHPFGNLKALVEIKVSEDNPAFSSDGGVLYNKDKTELLSCPCGKKGAYTVAEGTKTIARSSFDNCAIEIVTIPSSVEKIEMYSFYECTKLTLLGFAADNCKIEQNAFCNCTSLKFVAFSGSNITVDEMAFQNCGEIIGIMTYGDLTISESLFSNKFTSCEKIYGCTGSKLQEFTDKYGIPFVAIDDLDPSDFDYSVQTDGTALITGYHGSDKNVVVPAMIDGKLIVGIGDNAFNGNTEITSVDIMGSILSVGSGAFAGCTALSEIKFQSSLFEIGISAFANCTSLKEAELPEHLNAVSDHLFENCTSLTRVSILSAAAIGSKAFSGCTKLEEIDTPSGVLSVGASAFDGCPNLTVFGYEGAAVEAFCKENDLRFIKYEDFVFAESVEGEVYIKQYCGNGGDIVIPSRKDGKAVTKIGREAFQHCDTLTSVVIPGSILCVDAYAFFQCDYLTSVKMKEGVETLEEYAFDNCDILTDIDMPDSLVSIGANAFKYCISLETVKFGNGLKIIGNSAFENCSSLSSVTIPGNVETVDEDAFSRCDALTSVEISNGVVALKDFAFSSCNSLVSINIPASVESLYLTFLDCSSLKDITVDENNKNFKDIDGVLFTKDGTTLLELPCGRTGAYTVPDGVETLDYASFALCKNLTEVTLPDSVTKISDQTFDGCHSLTKIIIPKSVTEIGEIEFSNSELTIYGYEGSYAETYANDNGINFVAISYSSIGDVNGDGEVGELDSVELARYLANWNVTIDKDAADLDGDGEVGETDSVILARRLAGWNV